MLTLIREITRKKVSVSIDTEKAMNLIGKVILLQKLTIMTHRVLIFLLEIFLQYCRI